MKAAAMFALLGLGAVSDVMAQGADLFAAFKTIMTCPSKSYSYPKLEWTKNSDGSYSGDLHLGLVKYISADGVLTTTRAWNNMIPGPTMKMEPGATYHVTLHNDIPESFSDPEEPFNNFRLHTTTSLHVHGLHVSPNAPYDDVIYEVHPGTTHEYIYKIPYFHTGGTHLYHPHVHGSGTIQSEGGAVGMIIIPDRINVEGHKPSSWPKSMPEAIMVMQFQKRDVLNPIALGFKDDVFKALIYPLRTPLDRSSFSRADGYLVNGCGGGVYNLAVETGKWTRIRMLHFGHGETVAVSFDPLDGVSECTAALYSKDGISLFPAPRALSDPAVLLSVAGRADVFLRCDAAGSHAINIENVSHHKDEFSGRVGTLTVTGSGSPQGALSPFYPKRPFYLQDLRSKTPSNVFTILTYPDELDTRYKRINGFEFNGNNIDPILEVELNHIQEFVHLDSFAHPMHLHVNHVQFISFSEEFPGWEGWHQPGDWVDTVAMPGTTHTRWIAADFTGIAVMHCHVLVHADQGMLSFIGLIDDKCPNGAYKKCGGKNFTGDECCQAGYTCVKLNDYYSSCKPTREQ